MRESVESRLARGDARQLPCNGIADSFANWNRRRPIEIASSLRDAELNAAAEEVNGAPGHGRRLRFSQQSKREFRDETGAPRGADGNTGGDGEQAEFRAKEGDHLPLGDPAAAAQMISLAARSGRLRGSDDAARDIRGVDHVHRIFSGPEDAEAAGAQRLDQTREGCAVARPVDPAWADDDVIAVAAHGILGEDLRPAVIIQISRIMALTMASAAT